MATRDEMIAFIQQKTAPAEQPAASKTPSREEMISFIQAKATKPQEASSEKVLPLESAARGFAQGASLGFADEISGGVEALWSKAKGDSADLSDLYQKHRNESRSNFKRAEEANPGYYTAGEVGGGIATAAVPIGATATLARAVQTGARFGAANALGNSEAEDVRGLIRDTAAGATLGAAGGALAKGVEKGLAGVRTVSQQLGKKAATSATDLAGDIASQETGRMPIADNSAAKDLAVSARNRLKSYFSPDVDPGFAEFSEIAKKHGIDPNILPESVKFGPNSSASRASRSLAEGRFGEELLNKHEAALDQVRGAYEKTIQKYSKGLPVDEVTAGKVLRDSYDEGVTKFFDQMDFTHNSIIDQAPGLQITPAALQKIDSSLAGIEKFAKGRMARGVTETQRGQGQQLLNAVASIRAGNGSYKQTVEALRDIGEAAFQSKNSLADVPVDVQKMRKIYNDLNEGLIDTVKTELGEDISGQLVANNKAMSEFFGDQSLIARVMGDKSVAPENAFRSLVLSGDSQKIQALKKILPPEKWEYLKGAVLENLAKRDPEGNFTFKQLHNSMRSKKNSLMSAFDPEELADSAGLVRLGDRFGSPVLSSSGTGASLSFQDLYKVPANLSVDALAIRNANRSLQKSTQKINPTVRDVTPRESDIPSKIAGGYLGAAGAPRSESSSGKPPEKGEAKWVSDGAKKLIEHAGNSLTPGTVEELMKTRAGMNLLIRASDLKPGTKAMDQLAEKIRSSNLKGGE